MSNRDPRYRDSTHTDPFQASTRKEGQDTADMAKSKGQEAADTAKSKGEEAKQKAEQAAGKAQHQADDKMHQAASGLDSAADKIREKGGQQGGSMGSTATMAADKLDSASSYLRQTDSQHMMDDLESLIRRKPTESLLAAAGVGFVLSKIFR